MGRISVGITLLSAVVFIVSCGGNNPQSPISATNTNVVLSCGQIITGYTNITEGIYTNSSSTLSIASGNYSYNQNTRVLTYGVIDTWGLTALSSTHLYRLNYKRLTGQSGWICGQFSNITGAVMEWKSDYSIWQNGSVTTMSWTLSTDSNNLITIFQNGTRTTNSIYFLRYGSEEYLGIGSQAEWVLQ